MTNSHYNEYLEIMVLNFLTELPTDNPEQHLTWTDSGLNC